MTLYAGCYSHAASSQATASATTAAHSAAVTSDPRIDPVSVSSGRVTGAGQDQNRNSRNNDRDGSRIGKWSRLRSHGGIDHHAHPEKPTLVQPIQGHTAIVPADDDFVIRQTGRRRPAKPRRGSAGGGCATTLAQSIPMSASPSQTPRHAAVSASP